MSMHKGAKVTRAVASAFAVNQHHGVMVVAPATPPLPTPHRPLSHSLKSSSQSLSLLFSVSFYLLPCFCAFKHANGRHLEGSLKHMPTPSSTHTLDESPECLRINERGLQLRIPRGMQHFSQCMPINVPNVLVC